VDCSIVITTFNRARLLADTLREIVAQAVPSALEWEVLVVDNNSSDRTRETVVSISQTSPVSVRYELERRQGQTFARNTGIDATSGEIIVFTDDDVLPAADWLSTLMASMGRSSLDGVGGMVLPKWEGDPPEWLLSRQDLQMWLALTYEDSAVMLTYPMVATRRLVGANMAFRRRVFAELGRFDPALGHRGTKLYGGDEVEFVNRLLRSGKAIGYDPSIVVHHRIDARRLRKSFFVRQLFDHAVGEARRTAAPGEPGARAVERWEYRRFLEDAWAAAIHTCLGRPDAFQRQLSLASSAGRIWYAVWPSS
jgi:glycosyltransferase involved in cell wall biosynthesis